MFRRIYIVIINHGQYIIFSFVKLFYYCYYSYFVRTAAVRPPMIYGFNKKENIKSVESCRNESSKVDVWRDKHNRENESEQIAMV